MTSDSTPSKEEREAVLTPDEVDALMSGPTLPDWQTFSNIRFRDGELMVVASWATDQ